MRRYFALFAAVFCSPLLAAPEVASLRETIELFEEDRGNISRFYDLPMSPVDRQQQEAFFQDWRKRLAAVDFAGLPQDGKVDALLLKNYLEFQIRDLGYEQTRDAEVAPLLPFAGVIVDLAAARRTGQPLAARQAAIALDTLRQQASNARQALEADKEAGKKTKRTVARRASQRQRALQRTLEDWAGFYREYDPEFDWWTAKPLADAKQALEQYDKLLRERFELTEDAVIGDPIGEAALLDALASDMIPYSPSELIEIAEREYAWCEAELKRAARDLGFGDDWHKALDHVANLHVPPGEQPQMIRELATEAVEYLEKHDLVTIPPVCKETWRMEMMSPDRQRVNPYFTGGEVISVSYPTAGMAHEDKLMSLRGNNRHFCRATVHHELMPGHHLQLYMGARHRPYRKLFSTPFLVEGWCLYWEMLLWDREFQRSAEDRMGMLFWRTHRCARIIFSLSFHLSKMTADEAIDFLVEKVGHERRNAAAEVRRSVAGNYGPLYQAAYMLGGLQFRALRKELVDSGKMTAKAFHDAILREGPIPVEMIRASLGQQPLAADHKTQWRFYDLLK